MFCGSPGLSGRRCLSIIRVAYTWNPTVSRGSTKGGHLVEDVGHDGKKFIWSVVGKMP